MPIAATLAPGPIRQIVHRSRGGSHGFVTRLMSPGDLGRILKPFVFLDLVDNKGEVFPAFGLHPHSGLATLTYIAEGSVSYETPTAPPAFSGPAAWSGCAPARVLWHSGGASRPGVPAVSALDRAAPHLEPVIRKASIRARPIFPKLGRRASCWDSTAASRA